MEPRNVSFVVGVRDVIWTNPHLPYDDASFVPNPRASYGFVSNVERNELDELEGLKRRGHKCQETDSNEIRSWKAALRHWGWPAAS